MAFKKTYTEQFKRHVVCYYRKYTMKQTKKHFHITDETIRMFCNEIGFNHSKTKGQERDNFGIADLSDKKYNTFTNKTFDWIYQFEI